MIDITESVQVALRLGRLVPPGELNKALRSLGFRLYYDVYGLPRASGEPWQSEVVIDVQLYRDGARVDAQDACDQVVLIYPFATVPTPCIDVFTAKAEAASNELGGELLLDGKRTSPSELNEFLVGLASDLMREWGEEPGSEEVTRIIESNYGPENH